MNSLPSDQEIKDWLAEKVAGNQTTRVEWLAKKMHAAPATVKNWLFDRSKTMLPHIRAHMARVMREG
jgi:hypothetical protein